MKGLLIRPITQFVSRQVRNDGARAIEHQRKIFKQIIAKAVDTAFGQDHGFKDICSHSDYASAVPVRDYEGLREYFDAIAIGEKNVTWPGKPVYLAKTSGTTSGVKYIPITPDSLPNHINTARSALFNYASKGSRSRLFDGKVMFLSGSPILETKGGIAAGRLSGIVNHEIPGWLKGNQLPTYRTNCIDDWEKKVEAIVEETRNADLRLISGIPPWVQMYFERLLDRTGKKTVLDVFPRLQLFMHGGVNYEPYRSALEDLFGAPVDTIETFPASEGFIAFQDDLDDPGLLLNTHSGIYYEFVTLESYFSDSPKRVTLEQVEPGTDYAVIVNSNAGLWGYSLGDTVRFTSLNPFKLKVSGRVKHFISAFGEHVIAKEVEEALSFATEKNHCGVLEFTVAPQVNPPDGGLPYHEWFIEFDSPPGSLQKLIDDIDTTLRKQNPYYDDLVSGKILKHLEIRQVRKNGFRDLMKSMGKLGGQNKVPRLSNDRRLADLIYLHRLILT